MSETRQAVLRIPQTTAERRGSFVPFSRRLVAAKEKDKWQAGNSV